MIKPYVIFISKDFPKTKFAFDRQYVYIEGAWDTTLDLKNIVQVDTFDGCPYHVPPDYINSDESLIALWTNYYD